MYDFQQTDFANINYKSSSYQRICKNTIHTVPIVVITIIIDQNVYALPAAKRIYFRCSIAEFLSVWSLFIPTGGLTTKHQICNIQMYS
jgi:hypothetical protein